MLKRGQVTVFIIVGILILFLAAGTLFVIKTYNKEKAQVEQEKLVKVSDFDSVKLFIEECLKKVSKQGIVHIGFHGGYYQVPEPADEQIFMRIPYYFDLGQKRFPTKEIISSQFSLYVKDNLQTCLNDFTAFKNQGFEFFEKEIEVNVLLGKNVIFEMNYPLRVTKEDSVKEFREFSSTIPLNFAEIYSIVEQTILEQEQDTNFIPLGFISASSQINNYTFEISYLNDDVVAYSYIFEREHIDFANNEPYVFLFANRYNWPELSASNILDYIPVVENQRCYVGDTCSYNLNIYNDPFTFKDYSQLLEISPEGQIKFIPREEDVGAHSIIIKLSNGQGREKLVSFILEIKSLEK